MVLEEKIKMLELTTETHKTIIETHSYSWKTNLKNHCKSESVVGDS